jgi:hypothetical protein
MFNDYEQYISDAISMVSAWELTETEFALAVNDQAKLLAGVHLEPTGDVPVTSPYSSLQF